MAFNPMVVQIFMPNMFFSRLPSCSTTRLVTPRYHSKKKRAVIFALGIQWLGPWMSFTAPVCIAHGKC